jgi:hypothetical protein
LRNQRFFSLAELNTAIGGLVVELNARQMRGFGSSRAELFAEIDRLKLGVLPDQPYVFARWKRCRVSRSLFSAIGLHNLTGNFLLAAENRCVVRCWPSTIANCPPSTGATMKGANFDQSKFSAIC